MNIELVINRKELLDRVSVFVKSFEQNQMHDVFKCSCLILEDNKLSIVSSDGVSYCSMRNIPCQIVNNAKDVQFKVFIYTSLLLKILSTSSKKDILLKITDDGIVIKTESKNKIQKLDFEDFEYQREDTVDNFTKIEFKDFIKIFNNILPFASKDMIRPELSGINITEHVYVGTNGQYGLVYAPRMESIFPEMTLSESIVKFLSSVSNLVKEAEVGWSESSFYLKSENLFYSSSLVDVKFPCSVLHDVLDKISNNRAELTFKVSDLIGAINRVTLSGADRFSQIEVSIGDEFKLLYKPDSGIVSSEIIAFELKEGDLGFRPMVIYLSIDSVNMLKKLLKDGDVVMTVVSELDVVYFQQKGSQYLFYTLPQRKM